MRPAPGTFLARLRLSALVMSAVALPGPMAAAQPKRFSRDDLRALEQAVTSLDRPMKVRLEAALILGRTGDLAAVPSLVETLADPEFPVRAAAALSLGKLGDARAADPLLLRLDDPEPFVREQARDALGALFDRGAGRTIQELAVRSSPDVRVELVKVVAGRPPPEGDSFFGQLLADPDLTVRAVAEGALASRRPPEVQRMLLANLRDPDERIRAHAAQLCGQRRITPAVPELAKLLVSPVETEPVRSAAREALHRLADQLDPAKLVAQAHGGSKSERRQALALLSAVQGERAYDAELAALDDPDVDIRGDAALGLAALGDVRALKKLRALSSREENGPILHVLTNAIRTLAEREQVQRE